MKYPQCTLKWYLPTSLAICLVTIACQPRVVADEGDAEYVVLLQDSFEEGGRAPDGWTQGVSVPGVRYAWDRKVASDGSRSLSLRKQAKRYFPVAQWSQTLPHQGDFTSLEVSVQVKASKATKAVVDVAFMNAQNKWISHEWAAYIGAKQVGDPPANHDWKEYSGAVKIPPGTRNILIALQIYGPGSVWFDELVARYPSEGRDSPPAAGVPGPSTVGRKKMPEKSGDAEIQINVTEAATGRYLLAPSRGSAPSDGYGLVVALPGGAGTADFHPFIRRIQERALGDEYLVAQPLAVKWTPQQKIVWPTAGDSVAGKQFTTEQFVAKVIEDVASKQSVDRDRVFLLAWSSSGPAAYATLLQETSPAQGALVAMSVFKPKQLPPPKNARNRSFYVLHSREDRVCPFWMAANARKLLTSAGATVRLATYKGGHGWHGDAFGMIRDGVDWLEKSGE